jgi:enterochelin esterase-like enzyme
MKNSCCKSKGNKNMLSKIKYLTRKVCIGLFISVFSFSVLVQVQTASSGTPAAAPRGGGLSRPVSPKSPEILPDNRVIFRLNAPKATTVSVAGDWNNGATASENMIKDDTGLWTVTLGPLKPDYYGYKFTVDGITNIDPGNLQIRRDWQGYESVLLMPGIETDLYFVKNVPSGTLLKVWYDSPNLGFRRRMYIYTPPGYEKSTEKYPVLYLLHGGMNDEDTWTSMGRVNVIMDNLIAQKKAKPMIVVMPNGNPDQAAVSFDSYPFTLTTANAANSPASAGGSVSNMLNGMFEESLIKDVIPFIEANYRVIANKENRALIGYSMGGGQTYQITLKYPDVFDYIGAFGPAIFAQTPESEKQMAALKSADPKLYWVGVGSDDQLCYAGTTQILLPLLKKYNINYYFNESTGGHNWQNWRIYLSECVPMFFK